MRWPRATCPERLTRFMCRTEGLGSPGRWPGSPCGLHHPGPQHPQARDLGTLLPPASERPSIKWAEQEHLLPQACTAPPGPPCRCRWCPLCWAGLGTGFRLLVPQRPQRPVKKTHRPAELAVCSRSEARHSCVEGNLCKGIYLGARGAAGVFLAFTCCCLQTGDTLN